MAESMCSCYKYGFSWERNKNKHRVSIKNISNTIGQTDRQTDRQTERDRDRQREGGNPQVGDKDGRIKF